MGHMPNISFPKFGMKGKKPQPDIDASLPGGSVESPDIDVNVQTPSIDIKKPSGRFKMPKFGFKSKKPKADIQASLPNAVIEAPAGPSIDVEAPSLNVDIDKPSGKLDLHMPDMSLPKFGLK